MHIIGIPVIVKGDNWVGGVNYYLSLISSLALAPQPDIRFIIITNKKCFFDQYASEHISVYVDESLGENTIFQEYLNKIFACNLKLVKIANALNIDMLTHSLYSKKYKCKTIWWKPDFQENHYPAFFAKREIWERKRNVKRSAKYSGIIFSSQSACDDYHRFYKKPCQTHVLRFVPSLDLNSIDEMIIKKTLKKYNITRPFFYLPNQYWVHKNHELVLQSLIQYNHDLDFEVVSTGAMKDYRGSEHIDKIKALIDLVPDRKYKFLGLVPREEMLALMYACVAVLNPSRFEGWSTTVEEAKYMGKKLILSDLPVHREQNPRDSIFINVDDIKAASDAKRAILMSCDSTLDIERRKVASELYHKYRYEFAMSYINLIRSHF